jgi:hypothetical protein
MNINEQITEARAARRRRSKLGATVYAAAVLTVVTSLTFLGRSPVVAVAAVAMAVAYTTTRLYVEGNDELQRRRAVTACAIGCGVGIAWVIVDAIRIAVTGDDPDGPSRTLAITAAAWLLTEVLDGLGGKGGASERTARHE